MIFECSDGYRPTMPVSRTLEGNGWLAIQDLDAPEGTSWTPHKMNGHYCEFAPSYLAWQDPPKNSGKYEWPYGLVSIRIQLDDPVERMAKPRDSKEYLVGFKAFKEHCSKCHAVNGAGGILGPELNYPKNITEYWQRKDIEAFVRNPRAYRHESKMPSFQQIDERKIRLIVDYLEYMTAEKRSP